MSDESPKTVEEAVEMMLKISDIVERNQAATTWKKERRMRASELRECANMVDDAWKAEKEKYCQLIGKLEAENMRLANIAAVSRYKVGDKLEIDGIRMTCTSFRAGFDGYRCYHFLYFNHGELKELEFDDGELDALGARKVEA